MPLEQVKHWVDEAEMRVQALLQRRSAVARRVDSGGAEVGAPHSVAGPNVVVPDVRDIPLGVSTGLVDEKVIGPCVFNHQLVDPLSVTFQASSNRAEFEACVLKIGSWVAVSPGDAAAPFPRSNLAWTPPPSGWLKANCDVAIEPGTSNVVIAVLFRDCKGHLIEGDFQKVEKREWRRPSSAKDDDQTPISFSFDGLFARNTRRRHDLQDINDDDDQLGGGRHSFEYVEGDGRDEWKIRSSIGLDLTLDNEEEEDEFHKVAEGREIHSGCWCNATSDRMLALLLILLLEGKVFRFTSTLFS
ncbi:hypothetical protein LOK49_LG07G03245 [Camellia lanceoleosa]|uniref:Uncharacterized protein n=1 Tax=Camellia lanceoleosa TaxID=1840588 RepID=A0ACC0GYR0_9ERIC|nr:hypothetical protein LOK49_LG07G03245 [Camellia lanceoleosa]